MALFNEARILTPVLFPSTMSQEQGNRVDWLFFKWVEALMKSALDSTILTPEQEIPSTGLTSMFFPFEKYLCSP